MEQKSLIYVLTSLIENGKGDERYYLFDSNDTLIVRNMSAKMMLENLGYYLLLSQPVFEVFGKNICLDCEVMNNDTKR